MIRLPHINTVGVWVLTLIQPSDNISVPARGDSFPPTEPSRPTEMAGAQVAPRLFREHRTVSLYCCGCGEQRVVKLKCGSRSCPECRSREYGRLLRAYSKPLNEYREKKGLAKSEFKLLTLTMRNVKPSNREDMTIRKVKQVIRQMYKAFSRMRRWKKYHAILRGGLRVTEIKFNPDTGWNVHAHILYEGAFHPVCCKEMKEANTEKEISLLERTACRDCREKCFRYDWNKVSGSPVVDVKKAYNPRAGLRYILKYMSKAPETNGQDYIFDMIMKGFRMVQPFGCWYDLKPVKPLVACMFCGHTTFMSEWELWRLMDGPSNVLMFPSERVVPSPARIVQMAFEFGIDKLRRVAG